MCFIFVSSNKNHFMTPKTNNHEKDSCNCSVGNNVRILRWNKTHILSVFKGIFWIWGIFTSLPSTSQMIRHYVVTEPKKMKVVPISEWKKLTITDTVFLLNGKTITKYRLECGNRYTKKIPIQRRRVSVGDTVSIVRLIRFRRDF